MKRVDGLAGLEFFVQGGLKEQNMGAQKRFFHKLSLAAVTFGMLLISSVFITGQPASKHHVGMVDDWTHHHLVFSNPGTYEQAIAQGSYTKWINIQYDTRFILQQMKMNAVGNSGGTMQTHPIAMIPKPNSIVRRDWSVSLGTGSVASAMFPAKYTFAPIGTPSCANDYAVFPVAIAGMAGTAASATGTFKSAVTPSGHVTITNGSNVLTLTATGGASSGTSFHVDTIPSDNAASLATAINLSGNGSLVGVVASHTSGSATLTVTATTPGLGGNSIALAGTLSHFTWAGATLTGGVSGQANLVGINNLYSGSSPTGLCGATPSIMFAYYIGGGAAQTSPVLSLDGTKIAFVETVTNGSDFHVLTIGTTGSNGIDALDPAVPGTNNNAVDTAIQMNGNATVTRSSPFIYYDGDIAYVGDDKGLLHKFTGVFKGTPAEVTTGGWPVTVVASGNAAQMTLSGPVYDQVSQNVFIGTGNGYLSYVRVSASSAGACAAGSPPCLGSPSILVSAIGGTYPVVDPPLVDSTNGTVFEQAGSAASAMLVQANTSLGNAVTVTVSTFANGGNNYPHSGAFDNNYYNCAFGGAACNGFLYIGGYYVSGVNLPSALYRVGFNSSGKMNATTDGNALKFGNGSSNGQLSPLTEFLNGSTDWLFAGDVNNTDNILNFDITSSFPSAATDTVTETGGTGGIVIDNVSASNQASSIYFGTLTGSTAVKLTQAGLQ